MTDETPSRAFAIEECARLAERLGTAQRLQASLVKELKGLCERLDRQWYETDPDDEVKKGDPHPWTKEARVALAEVDRGGA